MRILTGVQPTGTLHIGNYFGAMKPCIDMQDEGDTFLFIADYHALTQLPDPTELRERVKNVAIDFLACGIDPQKTVFFRQSDVPEVTELTWCLSSVTTVGMLERCTTYKDKVDKGLKPNHGLFSYPVLMAADILLYNSDKVPVGKDQKQHLEVTRDIAIKFNNQYGEIFTIPEPIIREDVALVPGIDGEKMSKSYNNTIPIFGDEKKMRKLHMKIISDSTPMEDPKDWSTCTIYALYKLFAAEADLATMRSNYENGNYGYGNAKQELFEKYWDFFAPMRSRRQELIDNPDQVEAILQDGAARARTAADKTMQTIREAIGIR
ncbi:MAG: tryptophan--tRNA ligase [Lentisphaeria bacterium]|nr:tryptophan--tRNA ligase [Lentisphaeria bacterium]NQZ69629.1 tryptophan--tRNA ligase [Lentisphaeria bacterium]